MDDKKYVPFMRSYYDALKELPRSARANVVLSILEYAFEGTQPILTGAAKMAFILIQPTLDKSEEMRKTVKARWDKKKEATYDTQNNTAYHTHTDNTYDTKNDTSSPNKENEKEKESITPYSPPAGDKAEDKPDDPAFTAFWEAYPRKEGKGAARKAFAKIPRSKYKLLVPAVEAYKRSDQWNRDNGQYIPHPATWLNQGRWEDDPGTTMQTDKPKTNNPFLAMALEMEDEK